MTCLRVVSLERPDRSAFLASNNILTSHVSGHCSLLSYLYIFECNRHCCQLPDVYGCHLAPKWRSQQESSPFGVVATNQAEEAARERTRGCEGGGRRESLSSVPRSFVIVVSCLMYMAVTWLRSSVANKKVLLLG